MATTPHQEAEEIDSSLLKFLSGPDTSQVLDLDLLAKSALKSFAIIEPWYAARNSCQHEFVSKMIDKIVKQSEEYFSAIKASIKTAQDGYIFADDAMRLCKYISSGNHPTEKLVEFIAEMLEIADEAYERSDKTMRQFRAVRVELLQVSRQIPLDVTKIQGSTTKKDVRTRFVTLPISLPEHVLNENANISDVIRNTEEKSFSDVVDQLEKASQDLNELVQHVSHFTDWWGMMKTALYALQTSIPKLKPQPNTLRGDVITDRWENIKERYVSYERKIAMIQDLHPKMVHRRSRKYKGPVIKLGRLWKGFVAFIEESL